MSAAPAAALLEVADLSIGLRRGRRWMTAVDAVSLSVQPGRALGLVGESGCGKTLTALALLRLLPDRAARISAGSVRFAGEDLTTASAERLRRVRGREIGAVFQDPMTFLNPVLRVGDQVAEPLRCHTGLSARAARARTLETLAEVGLADPERCYQSYPHQLSGGMRQRALIAAALICDPRLLIADEPTTALDVTVQAQLLALLDRERRRRGLALILITHDLGVVARICDEVAVMYAGRVVERGGVKELFAAPAHPYTAGLLASVRALDLQSGARDTAGRMILPAIEGTVPAIESWSSSGWGGGCRFRDRCPRAEELCAREDPKLLELGLNSARRDRPQWAACHFPGGTA
jgi:peptide/nickel transport system ATP-binding protein